MKKYLFFLLLTQIILGQISILGDANYKIDIEGFSDTNGRCENHESGIYQISVISQNNEIYDLHTGGGLNKVQFLKTHIYNKNNKINRFVIYSQRRHPNGGCETDRRRAEIGIGTECYSNSYGGDILVRDFGWVNVNTKPEIKINDPGFFAILSNDEYLTISLPDNLENNLYRWKYRIGNGLEQDFPFNVNFKNQLRILGSGFLSEQDYGKDISVWVDMGCNKSNVINFRYLKSAPHIIESKKTDVICYKANDGKIKLQLDRNLDLKDNETLSISLLKDGFSFFPPNQDLVNIDLENDNSYQINDLEPGNYSLQLFGAGKTYIGGQQHKLNFTILEPEPVEFSTSKVDVWCFEGNDAEIHLNAKGGTNSYQFQITYPNLTVSDWINFSSGNSHQIKNLSKGNHKIKVRDSFGCMAKILVIQNNQIIGTTDQDKIETIIINQPEKQLSVEYTFVKNPTAYGFSNAEIVAKIEGGTPLDSNDKYQFEWKNSKGQNINDITVTSLNPFIIHAKGLVDETYLLTIKDKNYNSATYKNTCTIFESSQKITQPEPLKVILEVLKPISCNDQNEFGNNSDFNPSDGQRDESQDGQIIAKVTGGVQFPSGNPYKYTWKKQNPNGTWNVLTNQNQAIATELNQANYAFNVEDANGNILGTYQNNQLVKQIDEEFFLKQPEKLNLTFSTNNVLCDAGNNGKITVNVSGGTPPYTYFWSNGQTTQTISSLISGNYFVSVKDARGCSIQGSQRIIQPEGISFEVVIQKNPTCFNGEDGILDIKISGGTAPYKISWNNNKNTSKIENLKHGKYTITVQDANNCTLIQEYILENPKQIIVDLGDDRVLCNAQTHILNATINDSSAKYSWTSDNGFISNNPIIEVSQSGTYKVVVTTSLGCLAQDEVNIKTENVIIDSEFLISTQAYVNQEVILVDVSDPIGKNVSWIIPESVKITNQNEHSIGLIFEKEGEFDIKLRSFQGSCYADYIKKIKVEKSNDLSRIGDSKEPFIKEFVISPNPNQGTFNIDVKLETESNISLRIFDLTGKYVANEVIKSGQKEYKIPYSLTSYKGIFVIVLETPKGTLTKRLIIN